MNEIFNINRFAKFTRTYAETHSKQYLFALSIAGGFAIICILLYFLFAPLGIFLSSFINNLCYIVIALTPCFFAKSIEKNNSIFDFTLPASSLEKFIVTLLNYVVFIPALTLLGVAVITQLAALIPNEGSAQLLDTVSLSSLFNMKSLYITFIFQSFFWVGYHYFKRFSFIKTSLILLALMICLLIVTTVMPFIMLNDANITGHHSFDFGEVIVNSSVMDKIEQAISIPKYIIATLIPAGLWIVCFLKIRETEI